MTEPQIDKDADRLQHISEERDLPLTTDDDEQDADLGGGGGEAGSG